MNTPVPRRTQRELPPEDQPLRPPGPNGRLVENLWSGMEVMAASRNRMPSTSALPETVDLCADLGLLAREIHDHNRRVVMEGAADWADLAEKLAAAADRCRRQMVITLTDDNSGSR